MGEYEPDDSRDVTLSPDTAPGEPERTGPREDAARRETERQGSGTGGRRAPGEPAGEGRLAIDNEAGDPRPEFDQYAVNDPQALDKDGSGRDRPGEAVKRAADDI